VLRAEDALADGQGALIVRPRPGQVAQVLQQVAQVVEAPRRGGVLRAEDALVDGQSALVVRPRPGQVAAHFQVVAEIGGECRCGFILAFKCRVYYVPQLDIPHPQCAWVAG